MDTGDALSDRLVVLRLNRPVGPYESIWDSERTCTN